MMNCNGNSYDDASFKAFYFHTIFFVQLFHFNPDYILSNTTNFKGKI